MLRPTVFVTWVDTSTWPGMTSEAAGSSNTSSNVKPSSGSNRPSAPELGLGLVDWVMTDLPSMPMHGFWYNWRQEFWCPAELSRAAYSRGRCAVEARRCRAQRKLMARPISRCKYRYSGLVGFCLTIAKARWRNTIHDFSATIFWPRVSGRKFPATSMEDATWQRPPSFFNPTAARDVWPYADAIPAVKSR